MLPVTVALLIACITLGGATSSGFMSDVLLQLVSVPALLVAIWTGLERQRIQLRGMDKGCLVWRYDASLILPLAMVLCLVLIMLGQYIPLWGGPGTRGILSHISMEGGLALPDTLTTGSGSFDPAASRAALAAALPTLTIFLLAWQLDLNGRVRLIGWFTALGLASLALGILQVMQGPSSPLRFFEITNDVEAIGFFANRNHFAALLYATLIYGIAWLVLRNERLLASRKETSQKILWFTGFFCFIFLIVGGIALARSRAGILLTIAAFIVLAANSPAFVTVLSGREQRGPRLRRVIMVAAALLLLSIGQIGSGRFLSRFDEGITDSIRTTLRAVTSQAAADAFPIGTGLATFPSVYAVYEEGRTMSGTTYVNRAHNDWLEFALETGLPGIALMIFFLAWFALQFSRIWIGTGGQSPLALLLVQQTASLTVLLLLVHSLVDYPLRTASVAACFAISCALMTGPPRQVGERSPD